MVRRIWEDLEDVGNVTEMLSKFFFNKKTTLNLEIEFNPMATNHTCFNRYTLYRQSYQLQSVIPAQQNLWEA